MRLAVEKTALLIAPTAFYSFSNVIAEGLQQAGYNAVVANDEYPSNVFGKILGKCGIQGLLTAITCSVVTRKFIIGRSYDLVVIIKGRGISKKLLDRLKECATEIVAYNFDSFGYNPAPLVWYKYVTRYCTFDYADAEKYDLPIVDLFSSLPQDTSCKLRRYNVSAILRNHSARLGYLDAVLSRVGAQNVYIYIYELNVFTFIINFFTNPRLYVRYWRYIHFKSLPYVDYCEILKSSDFTIDYAHPRQTGITIRCFEALSAGTKLITNNTYIMRNSFFSGGNSIIYKRSSDAAELKRRYRELSLKCPIRYHRSVSKFLDDLLNTSVLE